MESHLSERIRAEQRNIQQKAFSSDASHHDSYEFGKMCILHTITCAFACIGINMRLWFLNKCTLERSSTDSIWFSEGCFIMNIYVIWYHLRLFDFEYIYLYIYISLYAKHIFHFSFRCSRKLVSGHATSFISVVSRLFALFTHSIQLRVVGLAA